MVYNKRWAYTAYTALKTMYCMFHTQYKWSNLYLKNTCFLVNKIKKMMKEMTKDSSYLHPQKNSIFFHFCIKKKIFFMILNALKNCNRCVAKPKSANRYSGDLDKKVNWFIKNKRKRATEAAKLYLLIQDSLGGSQGGLRPCMNNT